MGGDRRVALQSSDASRTGGSMPGGPRSGWQAQPRRARSLSGLLALAALACLGGGGSGGRGGGVAQGETFRRYMSAMEPASGKEARRGFGRGVDAFNAQRWEEAIGHFDGVARADSVYQGCAFFNLGLLYEVAGEVAAARHVLQQALELGVPAARTRLGLLAARAQPGDEGEGGGLEAALELFSSAVTFDSEDLLARRNEVAALHALGREKEAQDKYAAIVAEDPNLAGQTLEQIQVMMQTGDPGLPGAGRLERWLECDVEAGGVGGWSDVVLPSCRILDGERFLREEVAGAPSDASTWYQLGAFYRNHDMVWDSVRAMSIALRLKPDYDSALAVMGGTLTDNTNYSLAIRPLERSLEIHPGDLWARANLVLSLAWTCQWVKLREHSQHFVTQLKNGIESDLVAFPAPAHMLFIISAPPASLPLETYRRWVDLWAADMNKRVHFSLFSPANYPAHTNILRLGWVSGAGFQKSPGSSAIRGVFALHDRSKFEVHCFALKPDLRANDLRRNISETCDVFHDMGNIGNDEKLAKAVNALQPHVLIDVSGFSGDHRIKFLAHRPAPMSLTFCEYPGTLGAATGIDFIITDAIASPPEYQILYAEKLLLLPSPYLPNDYRATVQTPELATVPFPKDHPQVFCALHHVWKLDEQVFAIWMDLLRHAPESTLRLQECDIVAKEELRRFAEQRGIDPTRLIFNKKIGDYYEHITKLSHCALFLDAPKYNAHTSAGDALWAGVAVVTLPLELMVHRGAATFLHSTGLTATLVRSLQDYNTTVLRLGTNAAALEKVRKEMRDKRSVASFSDTPKWVAALDTSLRLAWDAAASPPPLALKPGAHWRFSLPKPSPLSAEELRERAVGAGGGMHVVPWDGRR